MTDIDTSPCRLTVRVIDATGQTLQFRCRVKGTGAWEKMSFPLGRKLEHWDGGSVAASSSKMPVPVGIVAQLHFLKLTVLK